MSTRSGYSEVTLG